MHATDISYGHYEDYVATARHHVNYQNTANQHIQRFEPPIILHSRSPSSSHYKNFHQREIGLLHFHNVSNDTDLQKREHELTHQEEELYNDGHLQSLVHPTINLIDIHNLSGEIATDESIRAKRYFNAKMRDYKPPDTPLELGAPLAYHPDVRYWSLINNPNYEFFLYRHHNIQGVEKSRSIYINHDGFDNRCIYHRNKDGIYINYPDGAHVRDNLNYLVQADRESYNIIAKGGRYVKQFRNPRIDFNPNWPRVEEDEEDENEDEDENTTDSN